MDYSKNIATERESSVVNVVNEDGDINSQVICDEVDGSQGWSDNDELTLSSITNENVFGFDDLQPPSLTVSNQSNDCLQPSEKERFEAPATGGFNPQSDREHKKRPTHYDLHLEESTDSEKPKNTDEPDKELVVSW